ncbi:hypothetical protein HYV12_03525 [Candidatus Dojkabacteria bacterium]|nr:hypothetical protein [Candidatus Dojkabacteria bacterium]
MSSAFINTIGIGTILLATTACGESTPPYEPSIIKEFEGVTFLSLVKDHNLSDTEIQAIMDARSYFLDTLQCEGPIGGKVAIVVFDEATFPEGLEDYMASPSNRYEGITMESDIIGYYASPLFNKLVELRVIDPYAISSVILVKNNTSHPQDEVGIHEIVHSVCQGAVRLEYQNNLRQVQLPGEKVEVSTSKSHVFTVKYENGALMTLKAHLELHARMLDMSAREHQVYQMAAGTISIPSQDILNLSPDYPYERGIQTLVSNLAGYGVTTDSLFNDLFIPFSVNGSEELYNYAQKLDPGNPDLAFSIIINSILQIQNDIVEYVNQ